MNPAAEWKRLGEAKLGLNCVCAVFFGLRPHDDRYAIYNTLTGEWMGPVQDQQWLAWQAAMRRHGVRAL